MPSSRTTRFKSEKQEVNCNGQNLAALTEISRTIEFCYSCKGVELHLLVGIVAAGHHKGCPALAQLRRLAPVNRQWTLNLWSNT